MTQWSAERKQGHGQGCVLRLRHSKQPLLHHRTHFGRHNKSREVCVRDQILVLFVECEGNINHSPELKILGVVATYTIHYEVNQVECLINEMRHKIVQLQKLNLSLKLFATY